MPLIQFGSTCVPQVAVRAYYPSRVESTRQQNSMNQLNCLEVSRWSMFSGSLPFLSLTGMSRNMRLRRGCFFTFKDYAAYYSLLGVSEYSTLTEVKCAYRRLAMTYHPDVNKDPGAEAKFIEITNAYEALIDEMKSLHEDGVKDLLPIKRICYDWYSLKTLKAKCTTCGGQGHVYTSVKTPLGVKQEPMACSSCNGTGHVLTIL